MLERGQSIRRGINARARDLAGKARALLANRPAVSGSVLLGDRTKALPGETPKERKVATGRNYLYFRQHSENEGPYVKFYLEDDKATFEYGCLIDGHAPLEHRFAIEIPADTLKGFYQGVRERGASVLEGENQGWSLTAHLEETSGDGHGRKFKHFVCELRQQINPTATEMISFNQPLFMVGGALGISG
jgi:hypothetical protein